MSSLIVEVAEISKIEDHGNADSLEIAEIKGWRVIVQKDRYSPGDKVVYFPVDTILPVETSDEMGVTKYLSKGRIRAAKLRGVISCGLVADCRDDSWEVGRNVADEYGAIKWEPPEVHGAGDAERDHAMFLRYTDIENIRNFPDVLQEGEEVVITEKIHGTNCRLGMIDGICMAGSHNQRRKQPEECSKSLYWMPWVHGGVQQLFVKNKGHNVILYCEIYGDGVQDLKYEQIQGHKKFRAFDIFIDDRFVGHHEFMDLCGKHNIPTVPVLFMGNWSRESMLLAGGKSAIANSQVKEGIVIKPVKERWSDQTGRVILKGISEEYLTRKGGSERH